MLFGKNEQPVLRKIFSISPLNEDPAYTLPMLRVERKSPTGERNSIYLRDSADIVKYINDSYPEPAVDIDGPINAAFGELKNKPGPPFSAIVLTVVPDRLAEVSAVYFRATRKAWLGCSLEERRHKRIEEGAWTEMEEWANEVRGLLRKKGGPLFLGEKLCLLDIRFVGLLKWAEVVGKPEDYARIMQLGGEEFARFWQAAKPIYCTEQD